MIFVRSAAQGGNQAALEKMLADDFRDLAPDGSANKAEALAAAMKSSAENKANANPATAAPDNYIIQCSANSATISHRSVVSGKDAAGKPWSNYRRSVHVLEKRGGQWAVVSTLASGLSDGEMLRYLELDWATADLKNDAGWLEQNFAEDYSGVSSRTGKFSSKAEDVAAMKAGKTVTTSATYSDMDVRRHDETAVVTGVLHIVGKDDKGKDFDRHIAFTDTWKKEDGRWLVWASQGTLITE